MLMLAFAIIRMLLEEESALNSNKNAAIPINIIKDLTQHITPIENRKN